MSATIRDVAREAGVSVATVSRVLNGSGPVRGATRERIEAVAHRLRYTPSSAARSLILRHTTSIGVLLPDLYGEFFSEVIRGIDRTAQASGYHLLLSSSHSARRDVEAALRAMHGRVDGLIVMAPDLDGPTLEANLPASLPVVLLNCPVPGDAYDSLSVDNYGGAYAMTRHLLELGHRRLAFVGGPKQNHEARERRRGFRAAVRERGPGVVAVEVAGDFSEAAGYAALRRLLRRVPRPTALFAGNDSMAIGALSAAREAGWRVPEELAVAGFDDIPVARYLAPPLSSVHVGISTLGERAAGMLLEAIEARNQRPRRQDVLPTTLAIRASCAAPPRGGGAGAGRPRQARPPTSRERP